MRLFVFLAILYVLAPGHPDVPLAGFPLGHPELLMLAGLIGVWAWTREFGPFAVRWPHRVALAVLIVIKLAMAAALPQPGWLAFYHANDSWTAPVERSIDFPGLGATRIDRDLSFSDTEFPVHFFNDERFNFGFRREVTQAFSVRWVGQVDLPAGAPHRFVLTAAGEAFVSIDGVEQAGGIVDVGTGGHIVEVRYRKPANIEGLLRLQPQNEDGSAADWRRAAVMPFETPAWQRVAFGPLAIVAWVGHAAFASLVLVVMIPALVVAGRAVRRRLAVAPFDALHKLAGPVVIGGLLLQGAWRARHLPAHVWTLTGGDDWLGFEISAREALLNGLLIERGKPLGEGFPFVVYPGYSYFVALVHRITGESLAGVILVNFLLLALGTMVVYRIARDLVGPRAALVALGWLLLLEQLDFVRYYTVTLLSENLFFLLLPVTVYWLVRYMRDERWYLLGAAAVAGGLAAITRPTMMLFLPAAVLVVAIGRWRARGLGQAMLASIVLITLWMAAVLPITYRNYVVSGTPVLITDGQARTFLDYNMPSGGTDNRKYYLAFKGGLLDSARTLAWILYEHPRETLSNWGIKAGFSLGMVHWMGTGTWHPELLLTSALYFAAFVLVPASRTLPAAFVHLFILTHLSTMLLSMPSNYGYRLVLPMYLLMPIFAGAVLARPIESWLAVRWAGRTGGDAS